MKNAILLSVLALAFGSNVFADGQGTPATQVSCSFGNQSAILEISKLQSLTKYGIRDLKPDQAQRLAESICAFDGVHQEQWSAFCVDKSVTSQIKGHEIPGLYLWGIEHGDLFADEFESITCTVL